MTMKFLLNLLDIRKVIEISIILFIILEKTTKVFMKDVISTVLKKDIQKAVKIVNKLA